VLLGRHVKDATIDWVSTDTYAGGRAAMQHLQTLGHRHIAYIGGSSLRNVAASRRQAYLDALTETNTALEPSLLAETTLDHIGGRMAMTTLLQLPKPPTAVFAVNDLVALGALEAAYHHGLLIPQDLSVVGFDDIFLASQSRSPLTTVAQPKLKLGRTAAELLIARLEHPTTVHREVRLPCELVERMTTAIPRQAQL
jgi:LacI family transcriptional regulator